MIAAATRVLALPPCRDQRRVRCRFAVGRKPDVEAAATGGSLPSDWSNRSISTILATLYRSQTPVLGQALDSKPCGA